MSEYGRRIARWQELVKWCQSRSGIYSGVDVLSEHVSTAIAAADTLILFRNLLDDPVVVLWYKAASGSTVGERQDAYCRLVAELLAQRERLPCLAGCDGWQRYLADAMSLADNALTRSAERGEKMTGSLRQVAAHDLSCLEAMFRCTTASLSVSMAPQQSGRTRLPDCAAVGDGRRADPVSAWLGSQSQWSLHLDEYCGLVHQHGFGIIDRYPALLFHDRVLRGIEHPDPVCLADLTGYDAQRAAVIDNTDRFVRGLPANNLLLYGDRGTGKSATVKATAAHFAPKGLRLVQVGKEDLKDLPQLLELLRQRVRRFVLFIDDLSFYEQESSFTQLKAILEGTVQAAPRNVLVYATSNRRHFVPEYFSDRGQHEIRGEDALQEKLALADRFGRTIVFAAPNQEEYLEIVEALARQAGLSLPAKELRRRAMAWTRQENSASPRTAKQFITHLAGELAGRPCDVCPASAIMQA